MQINIIENENCKETKITIECYKTDQHIVDIIGVLKNIESQGKRIVGIKDDETYCIEPNEVLYLESIDRKTFCYTKKSVYETNIKLYEAEQIFVNADFMRISKGCVVNLNRIKSMRPEFGGRLLLTLENSERICVSRQYANILKSKLGIGGAK